LNAKAFALDYLDGGPITARLRATVRCHVADVAKVHFRSAQDDEAIADGERPIHLFFERRPKQAVALSS
jgi:hypothetical protein